MSTAQIIGTLIWGAMFGALVGSTFVAVLAKLFFKQGLPMAVIVIVTTFGAIAGALTAHSIIGRIQIIVHCYTCHC